MNKAGFHPRIEPRYDIRACFSNFFRDWRLQNHLPMKQVAADLDVSIATVSAWESGARFPTGRHFERIAAYTDVPPCRLFCVRTDKCLPDECLSPRVTPRQRASRPVRLYSK